MNLKRRTYEILEVAAPGDRASRWFDAFILSLIALNVVALALETVDWIGVTAPRLFEWFETISVLIFTVEYLLRLWSVTADPGHDGLISGRVRFTLTPLALVDLLAFMPWYFPMLGLGDLRFMRAVRMFRLLKFGRYSRALRSFIRVFVSKKEELLVSMFVMLMLLVISSSLMYFAEHDTQPEAFSSIPAAMWWAVATLTTVGYGDIYPVTSLGKTLASVIAIIGIGMFALPAGILGGAFMEEFEQRGPGEAPPAPTPGGCCPHCGRRLDEGPDTAAPPTPS